MRGKWSPGPWSADDACFDRRIPIRGGNTAFGRPYNVALVNRPDSALAGQDKANAYLIAASPALAESAAEIDRLMLVIESAVRFADPAYGPEVRAALNANRAALSLAHPPKGEERD